MTIEELLERRTSVEAIIDQERIVIAAKRRIRKSYFTDPVEYKLMYPEDEETT